MKKDYQFESMPKQYLGKVTTADGQTVILESFPAIVGVLQRLNGFNDRAAMEAWGIFLREIGHRCIEKARGDENDYTADWETTT